MSDSVLETDGEGVRVELAGVYEVELGWVSWNIRGVVDRAGRDKPCGRGRLHASRRGQSSTLDEFRQKSDWVSSRTGEGEGRSWFGERGSECECRLPTAALISNPIPQSSIFCRHSLSTSLQHN